MAIFSNPNIGIAVLADIPVIKDLLNSAYRGESSKEGWTTEAYLIAGNARTDDEHVQKTMEQPGSIFLKYTNEKAEIIGCVNLQKRGRESISACSAYLQNYRVAVLANNY